MAGNETQTPMLLPPPINVNDSHKVYSIVVGCAVMCAVASITVLSRLFARFRTHNFGIDDYATLVALPAYLAWCGLAIYANLYAGVGKPLWEITLSEYVVWFKMFVGVAFLYPIMSTAIRIAVLLFYHRMFATSASPSFRKVNYALIGLQIIYLIIYVILPVFTCKPFHAAWTLEIYPTSCNPAYFNQITTSLYAVSLAYDVIITFLPLWPILRLQMSLEKRLKVALLFVLGFSATAAAAYKLGIWVGVMYKVWDGDPIWLTYQLSLFIPPQFANYGVTFWIPSTLEPTLALACASMPALQPQLVKWGRAVGLKLSSVTRTTKRSTRDQDNSNSQGLNSRTTVRAHTPRVFNGTTNTASEEELYGEYIRLGKVSGTRDQ